MLTLPLPAPTPIPAPTPSQNVSFMADCIKDAGLKTFLIAKTGTLDPTYYNGLALTLNPDPNLNPNQVRPTRRTRAWPWP